MSAECTCGVHDDHRLCCDALRFEQAIGALYRLLDQAVQTAGSRDGRERARADFMVIRAALYKEFGVTE